MKVWIVLETYEYEGDYVESVHATEAGATAAARTAQEKVQILNVPIYSVSEWEIQE